jgi:hypothetical protein
MGFSNSRIPKHAPSYCPAMTIKEYKGHMLVNQGNKSSQMAGTMAAEGGLLLAEGFGLAGIRGSIMKDILA